jgi:hypothetical protein
LVSLANPTQLDDAILHRQHDAQQALLRLAINAGQYTQKLPLLLETGQLAVALTGAVAGFVYLRTEADPGSQHLGESVHYQLYAGFRGEIPNLPMSLLSNVALAQIEQVTQEGQIAELEQNRRLLIPLRRHHKVIAMLELCSPAAAPFDPIDIQVMADLVLLVDSILKNQYLLPACTVLPELAQDLTYPRRGTHYHQRHPREGQTVQIAISDPVGGDLRALCSTRQPPEPHPGWHRSSTASGEVSGPKTERRSSVPSSVK